MNWSKLSVWLSWAAGMAGLGLFVWLFIGTDVLADLSRLPLALWLAIPWAGIPTCLAVISFARSIPRASGSKLPPFHALFTIRLGGEAINHGLASAYVAGEPVKGLLTVPYGVKVSAGLASALIGKTTFVAGEILFLIGGVVVAAALFGEESPVVSMLLAVTASGLAIVALGVIAQQRRLLGRVVRLLHAARLGPRVLWGRARLGADAIDAEIRDYYANQRRDFVSASFWAGGRWLLGAAELWAFLALTTDVANPLALAIVLEAGVAVVKGLSFFVPASIGAQEGGIVWLFDATGIGGAPGVTYAVFRRFREMIWIGLGFLALWWHLRRAALVEPLESEVAVARAN